MSRGRAAVTASALLVITIVILLASHARFAVLLRDAAVLPPNDPYVRLNREITAEFGMQQPVMWVIEARNGTMWTPPMLARLQAFTSAVLAIPGVIATDVISLASPNVRDIEATDTGLTPTYLMAEVPQTPEAIAALRSRVESNPNYRGVLISADGRAAMVVAGFRADADSLAVGRAALALRERYSDAAAAVHAVGSSVLRALAPSAWRPLAWYGTLMGFAALVILAAALGVRTASAIVFAAVLASAWTLLGAAAIGGPMLPWAAGTVPFSFLAAGAFALAGDTSSLAQLTGGLILGFAAFALLVGSPAVAFGMCAALGSLFALVAALAARQLMGVAPVAVQARWVRRIAVAVALLSLIGLPRLTTSFGLLGYGRRYLPGPGAADIATVERLFQLPTTLAVRVRGAAGFVAAPAVLEAFDGVAVAARRDPSVSGAMTLADLVKLVNRAFHGNREVFATIPQSRGLVARYLALSYSPGFRRFVDRALKQAALWIYLRSDRPADIARVLGLVQRELATKPVPDAEVDLVGGDGAIILVMARMARHLAEAAVVLIALAAFCASAFRGRSVLWRALLGGATGAAVMAGGLAWLGLPIDLVTLPCTVIAASLGVVLGRLADSARMQRLSLAMGVSGAVTIPFPLAVLKLAGLLLLACGVAGALTMIPSTPAAVGSRPAGES